MLDRDLQRRILETLAALYPEGTYDVHATLAAAGDAPPEREAIANTQYLAGHGLLNSGYVRRGMIGDNSFVP